VYPWRSIDSEFGHFSVGIFQFAKTVVQLRCHRFPCTVSPQRLSRILLHCSGKTVHENLSKHPIFAVLDVPLVSPIAVLLNVVFLHLYLSTG